MINEVPQVPPLVHVVLWQNGHLGCPNGPMRPQNEFEKQEETPFRGKTQTKHNNKAAHTSCVWILSMNGVTRTCRRPSWEPSGPILGGV